jgi:hypothetical protein
MVARQSVPAAEDVKKPYNACDIALIRYSDEKFVVLEILWIVVP